METSLWDYQIAEFRWIEGQFVPDPETFAVFAPTMTAFHVQVDEIQREIYPATGKFTWIQFSSSFEFLAGIRQPRIVLANGWLDMDILHDYRTRILFEVGHL